MAEENKDQEKTEQATPKRREEAREKGQVAKSRELASVAVLGACLIYFYFGAPYMVSQMSNLMRSNLAKSGQLSVTIDNIHIIVLDLVYQTCLILVPILLVVVLSGFIVNILQVGFLFSTESITPKFSKIDPLKGFQRLFSLRSLVELAKSILKMAIVGLVAYLTMRNELDQILPLMQYGVSDIVVFISRVCFKILYTTCLVLLILAIFDYAYQKWELEKNLKMSKQEVKEENKQTEGDPLVKGRIRRLQRDIARKRMMAQVPKADVVITNPTHLAVAVSYVPEKMNAPVVVAKGADFLAEKIKEIAKKHDVPIVENKAVAQVLYRMVEVEHAIPETLYKAIAEILVYVYSLKQKRIY
ncbi:MAG: flagellar biosynthesis protein FlhB [Deltaproteobacteria bacterium]|nr:flagellar biosynthesis protein FlhB [Deltaproteobacteria bacterium]